MERFSLGSSALRAPASYCAAAMWLSLRERLGQRWSQRLSDGVFSEASSSLADVVHRGLKGS